MRTSSNQENSSVMKPKSIRELEPLETGGVEARHGLDVQDHVAAGYCIKMLQDPSLKEVWCETHDDITLIWDAVNSERVEFVQVKSHELDQLWSVSLLCKREKKPKRPAVKGTSILERSLAHDRCSEACTFRLVTCRPVHTELLALSYPLSSQERVLATKELAALRKELVSQVGDYRSSNGRDCAFWMSQVLWEVVHSLDSIETKNLVELGEHLHAQGQYAAPDQVRELYAKLVRKVSDAGAAKWHGGGKAKQIKRADLIAWLLRSLEEVLHPGRSGGKVARRKMKTAGIAPDTISAAMEERDLYVKEILSPKYLQANDRRFVEGEVAALLQTLRAQLDAGFLPDSGPGFHSLCLTKLDDLSRQLPVRPPLAFVHGCMYNITDRCLHRFRRAMA
jgi:hypothetical protein